MIHIFQSFLAKMKAGLQRISSATRGESSVKDLENDAFVLAIDIGERRGRLIDFSDPDDQDLVMRALHIEKVKRGDWKMRCSVRIDQGHEGEEDGSKWADRLPAAASSDPLVSLLIKESAIDVDAKLAERYSQATAYAITFGNFSNDRKKVSMHMAISEGVLSRRIAVAIDDVKMQHSMFDRIERIPAGFIPLRGRKYATRLQDEREAGQCAWNFEEANETL